MTIDILKKWSHTGKDTMLAEIMQTGDELAAEIRKLRAAVDAARSVEPVGCVEKHTGSLQDMAIIVWAGEQPPVGSNLYLHPLPSKEQP